MAMLKSAVQSRKRVLSMMKVLVLLVLALEIESYKFPSASEEQLLASMCGYTNLSVLAAPMDGVTSGEVRLIFAQQFRLLEQVSPHLTWLRRGPLYEDEEMFLSAREEAVVDIQNADVYKQDRPKPSSVQLAAEFRFPQSSFNKTTSFKILHDLEQFEYLADRGWRTKWLRQVVLPAYRIVYQRILVAKAQNSHYEDPGFYVMQPLDLALIGTTYNRALLIDPVELGATRLSGGVLNQNVPWHEADTKFGPNSVVFIDDVLNPEALARLLEYCRSATVYYETKMEFAGGHLGAYIVDGFAPPILFQIAEELRAALPTILNSLPLRNLWSYKYTQRESGILVHKDQAKVNLNLWISPNEANLEPQRGGLKLYDATQLHMPRSVTPSELQGEAGRRVLAKYSNVTVPFKQNRIAIFDSALPHETDVGAWAPGYKNRRISITFLFGDADSEH